MANTEKDSFKNIQPTLDSDGKVISHKKPNRSWIPKILSVLAAVSLWLYVYQAVEEELVFKDIPINLENYDTDLDLDIVSGYETTLDVTLTGTKSAVNDIHVEDIKATVDLSNVTKRGTYTLDVVLDVPNSVKITDNTVKQLKITVDKTVERIVEIVPVLDYNIQKPYELGEVDLIPGTVTIKGPEQDLNTVKKAKVKLTLGNVVNNIESEATVELMDQNGYAIDSKFILVRPTQVSVQIPVYKTKKFEIVPDFLLDKDRFDYHITPSSVYLFGNVEDVEKVEFLKTEKTKIDSAGVYELPLMLPKDVNAYRFASHADDERISSVSIKVTTKTLPEPLVEIQ